MPRTQCFDQAASSQFVQVVVADADEALAHLRERNIACEGVDDQPWGRFVRFDDPDGNRWARRWPSGDG